MKRHAFESFCSQGNVRENSSEYCPLT